MKIILLGYMASGKSTIGKLLAVKENLPFIDLDTYIEQKENKSVSEIFKNEGEIYFRLQEHTYLKELLAKKEDFVLSLGGGTPCYSGNMDSIIAAEKTKSFYLRANVTTIVDRLQKEKSQRPLVADLSNEKLLEFISKHLFERSFFYEQAVAKINIDAKSVENIVEEIIEVL